MEYELRPAVIDDLQMILSWITTPELLKLWGGPKLAYPPAAERTWQEMGASGQNTFSLVDAVGRVVGFGQTSFRNPDAVHLGGIIVFPALRGKGLGRILCQQLIQSAAKHYQPARFTLNVYKYNVPGYNLYKSLGFCELSEDSARNSCMMCLQLKSI
jgi:ribosomal protein S18 acetylase RimI-like enzyme